MQNGGSRVVAAASDHDAVRLVFQGASVLIADLARLRVGSARVVAVCRYASSVRAGVGMDP